MYEFIARFVPKNIHIICMYVKHRINMAKSKDTDPMAPIAKMYKKPKSCKYSIQMFFFLFVFYAYILFNYINNLSLVVPTFFY